MTSCYYLVSLFQPEGLPLAFFAGEVYQQWTSLAFVYLRTPSFHPHFWRTVLPNIELLDYTFFFLSALKMHLLTPSGLCGLDEKLAVHLTEDSLYVTSQFLLARTKFPPSSLFVFVFQQLDYHVLDVDLLECILLRVFWVSWRCTITSFTKFGKFSDIFSSDNLSALFFLSSFTIPNNTDIGKLDAVL